MDYRVSFKWLTIGFSASSVFLGMGADMTASGRREFLFGSGTAAVLVGALPSIARAQDQTPRLPAASERQIVAELEKADVVGAAITVVQAGQVRAFIPYGRASIPFDIPVTPQTLFHTGSVGKHVTALAILQLAEAGRLQLDWPIGRVVTGLPDWIAAVSIRDLLGHTGGIPDYESGFEWDRPYSLEAIIGGLAGPSFAPGQAWSYSNTGYVLLGQAIETLSGLTYAAYVAERLFGPAGLPLARPDAAGQPIVGRAEPYDKQDGVVTHATRMSSDVSAMPDGGLLFSSLDWAPWMRAVEGGRLLNEEGAQTMFTSGVLTNGVASGYGFGWFVDEVRGQPVYHHSGGVPGFVTYVEYHPAEDVMAVATFNSTPRTPFRPLVELTIETVAPGTTTLGLEPRQQSARRDERLRSFLLGGIEDSLVLPNVLLAEQAVGRAPSQRVSGELERADFLESHAVAGGEIARYRLRIGGMDRLRQVGWTPDDRVFLHR